MTRGERIHEVSLTLPCPKCEAKGGDWCRVVTAYRRFNKRTGYRLTFPGGRAQYLHQSRWREGLRVVSDAEAKGLVVP